MAEKTRRLLLISNSKLPGEGYLDHCENAIKETLNDAGVKHILFLPYARPGGISHDEYTDKMARPKFHSMGFNLSGADEHVSSSKRTIENAEAIFVGGGNTFVLLRALYDRDLFAVIRERVEEGMPYLGASAGINVAGNTICTTNDNPIIQVPSFTALGLVPFIFKPHYLDPDPSAKHTRESDETRIKEYHTYNRDIVVGLREGGRLEVKGDNMMLRGNSARVFYTNGAREYQNGSDLSHLLHTRT